MTRLAPRTILARRIVSSRAVRRVTAATSATSATAGPALTWGRAHVIGPCDARAATRHTHTRRGNAAVDEASAWKAR